MLPAFKLDRKWLGMAGVPPHDNARAYAWEQRLHGVMLGMALLAILAFYLGEVHKAPAAQTVGRALEWLILAAFCGELLWMLSVTRQKLRYLATNWLDLLIILVSGMTIAGHGGGFVAWMRLLRLAVVGMALTRAVAEVRSVFSPGGLPYVLGFAVIAMLSAAGGFYWLDPAIRSYSDGLWLAFVTAATIGYGDVVPTTTASRVLAGVIAVIGIALLSMVTASIAAFFIGEDEKTMRKEMHRDIRQLREEVAQLIDEEERRLRRDMHADVRELREELRQLREDLKQRQAGPRGG